MYMLHCLFFLQSEQMSWLQFQNDDFNIKGRNREFYFMKLEMSQGNYFPQSMLYNFVCLIMENFGEMLVSAKYFVKKNIRNSL